MANSPTNFETVESGRK